MSVDVVGKLVAFGELLSDRMVVGPGMTVLAGSAIG